MEPNMKPGQSRKVDPEEAIDTMARMSRADMGGYNPQSRQLDERIIENSTAGDRSRQAYRELDEALKKRGSKK